MIVYLLIALGLAAAAYYFIRKMPGARAGRLLHNINFIASIALLVAGLGLLFTGRWTAALLPLLLGGAGLIAWAMATRTRAVPPAGSVSAIATRMLRLQLDHGTGRITGEIVAGRFAGRRIESLAEADAVALLAEAAQADPDSARLVEAYLDREHPRWRSKAPPGPADAMTRAQAYAVLGLEPGAPADAIKAAHRRLMQEHHPDRGGSAELAAKINRARDMLLGE